MQLQKVPSLLADHHVFHVLCLRSHLDLRIGLLRHWVARNHRFRKLEFHTDLVLCVTQQHQSKRYQVSFGALLPALHSGYLHHCLEAASLRRAFHPTDGKPRRLHELRLKQNHRLSPVGRDCRRANDRFKVLHVSGCVHPHYQAVVDREPAGLAQSLHHECPGISHYHIDHSCKWRRQEDYVGDTCFTIDQDWTHQHTDRKVARWQDRRCQLWTPWLTNLQISQNPRLELVGLTRPARPLWQANRVILPAAINRKPATRRSLLRKPNLNNKTRGLKTLLHNVNKTTIL